MRVGPRVGFDKFIFSRIKKRRKPRAFGGKNNFIRFHFTSLVEE
jgi:hypothetical protein